MLPSVEGPLIRNSLTPIREVSLSAPEKTRSGIVQRYPRNEQSSVRKQDTDIYDK